ncbi:phytanoyl-CoA dioxygenase family protein [Sneathiella sp. HT1-7]|uniref:phytanoyl-CoA dioxygenase family protein n=1 Tax=Sneathiella sp. HT1-7 TaxID=2887192 RepID=UPI001D140963|nr:phytanoyl-CoA dioxygenase family protein [Sneathiella sp. HT1-7]MCC3304043.1 phytanoyl-CoA dioxygenase family protein [Sneathiella sp. HT1-7]
MNNNLIRSVTDEEIRTFQEDGVVCLRGFFNMDWIKRLRDLIDEDIANPSGMVKSIDAEGATGFFFGDTFVCHHLDGFKDAVFNSPASQIAASVLKANKVNLLFDQILVKEPDTSTPTPWHQDYTYWPVAGDQVATLWLALDPVTFESGAVEYLRGSHRWGKKFLAISFDPDQKYEEELPEVPDVEAAREDYDIVSYELEPGDCTLHHGLTLHGAQPNRTPNVRRRAYIQRWAGHDVTYNPRPNLQKMLRDPMIPPGAPLDSDLFPVVWQA